jgi:hypothetical protein
MVIRLLDFRDWLASADNQNTQNYFVNETEWKVIPSIKFIFNL